MRTDKELVAKYKQVLAALQTGTESVATSDARALMATELCLHFVAEHLPDEDLSCVPYLMLGYPRISAALAQSPRAISELFALRHLCHRFASVAVWLDACRRHPTFSEVLRCYDIQVNRPVHRRMASPALKRFLEQSLGWRVSWVPQSFAPADPGEHLVRIERGDVLLSYKVPPVPNAKSLKVPQHQLSPRHINPPIILDKERMLEIARRIDERESLENWPRDALPPLKLEQRLAGITIEPIKPGLYQDGRLTLEGSCHLVGMLSSGKSTLVWGILFALTSGGTRRRIAMLASDTIQAATVVARLRRHGVSATVLSSFRNREKHLNSIHWQQALSDTGWSLASVGDLVSSFGAACPLDGLQPEPKVVRGSHEAVSFPTFREKPCHELYPSRAAEERSSKEPSDPDDDLTRRTRSCPLWNVCPAQEQQRLSVDAQVIVMTPQAFVHMTPDPWVSERLLTIPELLQFTTDLVILDEVDSIQKSLDETFAPRSAIMGDERGVYAPDVGARTSEALRERSGAQFRREINARWQANFYTFFRLIGALYALLQNEESSLAPLRQEGPFTAGSILYDLWVRRMELTNPSMSDSDDEFLRVIQVAAAISRNSRGAPASEDDFSEDLPSEGLAGSEYASAASSLQRLARELLVTDYYANLIPEIESALDGPLKVFNASVEVVNGNVTELSRRENALAILLAVITDLVLWQYNWLVRTQPAVAADLGIDEGQIFSQASNLIRHYRSLLPANPAGAMFGLYYDRPSRDRERQMGGKLTLVNHLGVGRHLIAHLHDLLAAEGQAGPHVLMLSGTSWAGGEMKQSAPNSGRAYEVASPCYDVQVPVRGVLLQPQRERVAIAKSIFSLVSLRDSEGLQLRASGLPLRSRRRSLASMVQRLGTPRDGRNLFEEHWRQMGVAWGEDDLEDRRRVLLVVNSYADASVVADALVETLEGARSPGWQVRCLVPDGGDDPGADALGPVRAQQIPRSLVERFGALPERSVLVAPISVIARGHNILNDGANARFGRRAAISSIYFLHRPHPRPDDLAPVIGRLNRFALERFERGLRSSAETEQLRLSDKARRMRFAATRIVREGLDRRTGYSGLPPHYKAQFAWDLLTPLWQTIGRGIRNGCPVFVGFVDRQFAVRSFQGSADTGETSALVQVICQLDAAMDPSKNPIEWKVAQQLYAPFLDALRGTKGLKV